MARLLTQLIDIAAESYTGTTNTYDWLNNYREANLCSGGYNFGSIHC